MQLKTANYELGVIFDADFAEISMSTAVPLPWSMIRGQIKYEA
jgi:hypothetical protein